MITITLLRREFNSLERTLNNMVNVADRFILCMEIINAGDYKGRLERSAIPLRDYALRCENQAVDIIRTLGAARRRALARSGLMKEWK